MAHAIDFEPVSTDSAKRRSDRRIARRALRWAYWRGLGLYRRLFQHRNHVFRSDPDSPPPRAVPGLSIERVEAAELPPPELREELVASFGARAMEPDARELAEGRIELPSFATAVRRCRSQTELWVRNSRFRGIARIPGRLVTQVEDWLRMR